MKVEPSAENLGKRERSGISAKSILNPCKTQILKPYRRSTTKFSYYSKNGHFESTCYFKKRSSFKKSSKRRYTNHQGPKQIWVPKSLLTCDVGTPSNNQERTMIHGQGMLKTLEWKSMMPPLITKIWSSFNLWKH